MKDFKIEVPRIATIFLTALILGIASCNANEEKKTEKIDYGAMLDTLLHHHHPDTIMVLEEPDSLKNQKIQ